MLALSFRTGCAVGAAVRAAVWAKPGLSGFSSKTLRRRTAQTLYRESHRCSDTTPRTVREVGSSSGTGGPCTLPARVLTQHAPGPDAESNRKNREENEVRILRQLKSLPKLPPGRDQSHFQNENYAGRNHIGLIGLLSLLGFEEDTIQVVFAGLREFLLRRVGCPVPKNLATCRYVFLAVLRGAGLARSALSFEFVPGFLFRHVREVDSPSNPGSSAHYLPFTVTFWPSQDSQLDKRPILTKAARLHEAAAGADVDHRLP